MANPHRGGKAPVWARGSAPAHQPSQRSIDETGGTPIATQSNERASTFTRGGRGLNHPRGRGSFPHHVDRGRGGARGGRGRGRGAIVAAQTS